MGKAKQAVFKACESLEDHKELFHIFPTGDKYISLVTGSISAIVKAAVNHQAVATGVSKILADNWDDIKYPRGLISGPFNNEPVRPYVALFYTEVFKVLVGILVHWHQSRLRRVIHSFNFGYVENLVGKARSNMKELMTKVEQQMQPERWNKVASKEDLLPIGEKLQLLLREQARMNQSLQLLAVKSKSHNALSLDIDDTKLLPQESDCSSLSAADRTMSDFKDSAQHLRSYLQDVYYASLKDQTHNLSVSLEVVNIVQQWVTTPVSSCLWIDGPFNTATPSQNTLMSSSTLDTIQSMNLPVISYFCLNIWEYETGPPRDSELVRMVYSLLYQLLRYIPDSLPPPAALDSFEFSSLDGSTDSLATAIAILDNLLLTAPRTLFCLINGIQLLDDGTMSKSMELYLEQFVKLFCSPRETPPLSKVLFTTDGFTPLLSLPTSLDQIERCTYDQPMGHKRKSDGNSSLMITLQQAVESIRYVRTRLGLVDYISPSLSLLFFWFFFHSSLRAWWNASLCQAFHVAYLGLCMPEASAKHFAVCTF